MNKRSLTAGACIMDENQHEDGGLSEWMGPENVDFSKISVAQCLVNQSTYFEWRSHFAERSRNISSAALL